MRTLFTIGFSGNPFMGQDQGLSKEDKAKFAKDLDQAVDKSYAIDAWIKKHPNITADLGDDYDRWVFLAQDEAKYGSAAKALDDKFLADSNADISPDDLQAANYWITAISRMYVIVANHTGKPLNPPVTNAPTPSPAGPGAPQAGPEVKGGLSTPLVVGIGAAAVFGLVLIATAKG